MSFSPSVPTLISSSNVFVVGNTASGNALSVQQVGAGNVFAFSNASGGSNVMVMNNLGRVGVGTASPNGTTHVWNAAATGGPRLNIGDNTAFAPGGLHSIAALTSTLGAGNGNSIILGRTNATNDAFQMTFMNVAQGSTTNYLGFNAFGSSYTAALAIQAGGNVGIGTTSPSSAIGGALLDVYATGTGVSSNVNISAGCDGSASTANKAAVIFNIKGAGGGIVNGGITHQYFSAGAGTYGFNFQPGAVGTSVMSILGSGNVGIGTASPSRVLHVTGGGTGIGPVVFDCTVASGFTDTAFLVRVTQAAATTFNLANFQAGGNSDRCVIRGDGNIYNTNSVYGAISDRNLKENIVPARSYMDDLNKLKVVKFSFKEEQSPVPTQLGLIAQDVEEVFPGLVDTDKDGNKNLKYSILNMMMLKTVQELSAENTALKSRLDSLEARLEQMQSALAVQGPSVPS